MVWKARPLRALGSVTWSEEPEQSKNNISLVMLLHCYYILCKANDMRAGASKITVVQLCATLAAIGVGCRRRIINCSNNILQ